MPRASASAGCWDKAVRSRATSRCLRVTGPRRFVPSVEYEKRTSRSPLDVSSSCTTDAKRLSPACWRTVSSSTRSAGPHGVAVFVAMGTTLRGEASQLRAASPPRACRLDRGELVLGAQPVLERVVTAFEMDVVRARRDVLVGQCDRRCRLLPPDRRLPYGRCLGRL